MRTIDGDALLDEICRDQCERKYKDCDGTCEIAAYVVNAPTVGGWISADKRPPKQGRYLVWGLTRITPDHYDEANGLWEIQPAFWFEKSGWDRKVKFWQSLPEPPKEADKCNTD